MKKIGLGLCTILFFATACKKDNNDSVPITTENLAGNYKFASATVKYGSSPEQDYSSFVFTEECEKDDITTLKTDGTYTVLDAGVQCDPPTEDSGTWSLSGSNTIVMDGEDFTISRFDGKTLQLTDTYTDNGQTITLKLTLSKQ